MVVIAAGAGSFVPRRLPLPGAERFEGTLAVLRRAQDGAVPRPADPGRRRRRFGARLGARTWSRSRPAWRWCIAATSSAPRPIRSRRCAAWSPRAGCELVIGQISGARGRGRPARRVSRSRAADGERAAGRLRHAAGLLRAEDGAGADRRVGPQPRARPDRGRHRGLRDQPARDLRHRRHLHLSRQAQADPVRASTRRR